MSDIAGFYGISVFIFLMTSTLISVMTVISMYMQ